MTTRRSYALVAIFMLLGLTACSPGNMSGVVPAPEKNLGVVSPPRRVVSLCPAASEILAALKAADHLAGITIHDSTQPGLEAKPLIGGFAHPDVDRILKLDPDCIIAAPFHAAIGVLRKKGIPILLFDADSLAGCESNIRQLGRLVGKEKEAEDIIARERGLIELATAKTAKLAANPRHVPLRTVCIMGGSDGRLLVPGDDSFQNELIKKAGGQPPSFGKRGTVITITPDEWRAFDPEFVYFCGEVPKTVRQSLNEPPWGGVTALKKGRVFLYPCDIACRISTRYGYFSLWLSSDLYGEEYGDSENQVSSDTILSRKSLDVPFAFVGDAEVMESRLFDMPARTLLLRFTGPQTVLSSLSGWSEGIHAVGNHSSSSLTWSITHHLGLAKTNARVLALFGLHQETSTFLHTGADVANLAYAERGSDGIRVGVLATAGVQGNAMRASVDVGNYVEPGTINLIILTNRKLSPAAMARSLITATEAKTAALEDLDIRSTYTGTAATGTGTDNVVVVSGNGAPASMSGGHTKLGELVAKAVYVAVREAIEKQNRLYARRDIFRRLAEHKISLPTLFGRCGGIHDENTRKMLSVELEKTFLIPRYAGFLEAALALSDSYDRGLVQNTEAFLCSCLSIAGELAGKDITELDPIIAAPYVSPIMQKALNALATGILHR